MSGDHQLIRDLLAGRVVRDRRGSLQLQYLKEGSTEEKEARHALARMLRSSRPLDLGVRCLIAVMIDPDCDEADRRIRFKHKRRGQRSNALAEKEVAEFIWSQRQAGRQVKVAVDDARKKFGLEQSRVKAIWGLWGPILKRLKRES
jgi:hypothetical protein